MVGGLEDASCLEVGLRLSSLEKTRPRGDLIVL